MSGRRGLTIVVSASVAATPAQAGWTWAVLQYLLGFRRLGHRVLLVDSIGRSAVRPKDATLARSANARMFSETMAAFGFADTASLVLTGSRETVGLPYAALKEAVGGADLLFNISGTLRNEDLLAAASRRVYLDVDPAFTQLWQHAQRIDMGLAGHTDFRTVGANIGQPSNPVPTLGLPWAFTMPPVVLERWPVAPPLRTGPLTTIANWRGYGSVEYEGVFHGQKAHALRELITLPTLTDDRFLLALAIDPAEVKDLAALSANRWNLADPAEVCGTPARYQAFVHGSKAEFAVAKSGYVTSKSGWFSDRSVCYLASGRPVIAQDTGFGRVLPIGPGLLAFRTTADASEAIRSLDEGYEEHARGARALAEEYLDSDLVLGRLLAGLGV